MAMTRAGNVIRCTADGDVVPGIVDICDIMYVEGTTSTVTIHAGPTSAGNIVWEASMAMCCKAPIRLIEGCTISMTGTGGVLYLYMR